MIYILDNLKRARIEFKYSCKDISEIIGISKSYYWQIENQKRKLDYAMAVRISSVFGLQPDEMFFKNFADNVIKPKKKPLTVRSVLIYKN